jgi:NADH-quinone oxidoreductase subunit G
MGGRNPKLLMDIHNISDVNNPSVDLSEIPGPPTGAVYEKKKLTEGK